MNEAEKKTITEAADSLALLALGLRNGDYMSAADIASAIDRHVGQLRQARDGDKGLCASPLLGHPLRGQPSAGGYASLREKIDPAAPTPNRGLVGIRFNDMSIVAWNLVDNKNIRVTAKKLDERCWHVDGYAADTLRISAAVFGGKHATLRYVRFIRNGLMSRVMRRKHARRAANLSNASNPN